MNIFKFGTISQQFRLPGEAPDIRGEAVFTTAGTFTWVAPEGVTSVSVVAIGGGQGGGAGRGDSLGYGGCSGGLAYKNSITVVPGQSYTVVVGSGGASVTRSTSGTTEGINGGDSYFKDSNTVWAQGGKRFNILPFVGDGGGNVGISNGFQTNTSVNYAMGGAGAAGYGDIGASGSQAAGAYNASSTNNAFEPGRGTYGGGSSGITSALAPSSFNVATSGNGGGTGIYGRGLTATLASASGSGGNTINTQLNPITTLYGGGGFNIATRGPQAITSGKGGDGAVRIVWGTGRAFPSTDVGPS
jgi:hypothetical protein